MLVRFFSCFGFPVIREAFRIAVTCLFDTSRELHSSTIWVWNLFALSNKNKQICAFNTPRSPFEFETYLCFQTKTNKFVLSIPRDHHLSLKLICAFKQKQTNLCFQYPAITIWVWNLFVLSNKNKQICAFNTPRSPFEFETYLCFQTKTNKFVLSIPRDHHLSLKLICAFKQKQTNLCFQYPAITSSVPFFSQLNSLRICLHKDIPHFFVFLLFDCL